MRSLNASGEKTTLRLSTSRRFHALGVVRTNGGERLSRGNPPRRVLLDGIVGGADFLFEPALHRRVALLQRAQAGAYNFAAGCVISRRDLGVDEFCVFR